MNPRICQPNLPGESGLSASISCQLPPGQTESEEQFFPGGILQFQITRSQGPQMLQDSLSDAEAHELGLYGGKHGFLSARSGPFLQDSKLLRFVLQVPEDPGEENADQVFKSDVLLEIGRIRRLTQNTVNGIVANRLVENPAGFVPAEVVGDAPDYLFEVIEETSVACQVVAIDRAASPWRSGPELNCGNGGVDEFLSAGASQVSRQSGIGSQIPQETLRHPCELLPLLIRHSGQSVIHIGVGSIPFRLLFRLRLFCFHSKTRVWHVFRMELLADGSRSLGTLPELPD